MSVIVTNARNRIAYNIVRSLGEKGITVYTADSVPRSMSFASRYSRGHFIYPSPYREQRAFIDSIIDNAKRLGAKAVIPVYEETFLMAKFKDELARHFNLVIPDYGNILLAHNKDRWSKTAENAGVPVPRSYDIGELRKTGIPSSVRFPVLIKPKQGGGGWAIKKVEDRKCLEAALSKGTYEDLPWDRFFLQERIEGENHCVAMLFCNGSYRAKVTYKQLRDYPVTGGQATLRVSINNRLAEEYLKTLLERLNWHGVCQADFVVDKSTGTPYLIDLNPRFWGSLAQAIASGVDFPYLVYKIAVDGDVPPVEGFRTGAMSRWIGGDVRAFMSLFKTGKKTGIIKNFFSPLSGPVYYDDFSLRDPLPFFVWTWDTLSRAFKGRSLAPSAHDSLEGVWK